VAGSPELHLAVHVDHYVGASGQLDHVDPRHDHHDDEHHHDDHVDGAAYDDNRASVAPSADADQVGGMSELEVRHIIALALHHYHSPVYDSRCPVDG
jgi:hypothetical protein